MARRPRAVVRAHCAHEGCKEHAVWHFDTQREAREHRKDLGEWRCLRHDDPEKVLSPTSRATRWTLVALPSQRVEGLYWNGFTGLASGPGFRAWADDFPEGTKLIVTARIEMPEGAISR